MAEILLVASSSGEIKQRCPDLATFPLFKMDKVELSLVQLSGLILSGCVGKHADSLAQELVVNTEGKTDCQEWGILMVGKATSVCCQRPWTTIEPIGIYLTSCQSLKHQANKTKIKLGGGMSESSFKILDQTFTPFHPRVGSFYYPSSLDGDKACFS
jgi:hypothetical protein